MKLKQIPANTVVHTPTEAEAKELLEILHENEWSWVTDECLVPYHESDYSEYFVLYKKFTQIARCGKSIAQSYKIITLAEFKERYFEEESHNLSQNSTNCDKSHELNLCELLRGHEGETFYSPCYGVVELTAIRPRIEIQGVKKHSLTPKGSHHSISDGQCMLYPSRALYEQYPLDPYAAWMKWQEEHKKPFICIHWGEVDCNGDEEEDYTGNTYFRTPADRDKCIEEIKAIIEKYSKK